MASSLTLRQVLDDPAHVALLHDERAFAALTEAAHYVSQVLTVPDPRVGRPGPVCPFARSAVQRDMVTLTILPLRTAEPAGLRAAALSLKTAFDLPDGAIVSAKESLRAVLVLLPYLETSAAADLVESVQKELKPAMVKDGLMVGEFYPGCSAPGLNNPEFRPADTSFVCLAIRRMTASDLPFLVNDADFLESYVARFGDASVRKLTASQQAPDSVQPLQEEDGPASLVTRHAERPDLRSVPATLLNTASL